MLTVLGVSGSPINSSNTDRAVKAVLYATGLKTEFIKLSDYRIAPCNACLSCIKTNRCIIKDDGIWLAQKAREADALVVGCYTPYSSIDARTKAFLERLYPLRHIHGLMQGKPGGAVVTCGIPHDRVENFPPLCDMAVSAIKFYMMEEGMNFVGSVKVLGNVPCVRCGSDENCNFSGLKMIFGHEATVSSVGINQFEDQPESVKAALELGYNIKKALANK